MSSTTKKPAGQQAKEEALLLGSIEPFKEERDFFLSILPSERTDPKSGRPLRPCQFVAVAGVSFQAHSSRPIESEDRPGVMTKSTPEPGVVVPLTYEKVCEVVERAAKMCVRWFGQKAEVFDLRHNAPGYTSMGMRDEPLNKYLVLIPKEDERDHEPNRWPSIASLSGKLATA